MKKLLIEVGLLLFTCLAAAGIMAGLSHRANCHDHDFEPASFAQAAHH